MNEKTMKDYGKWLTINTCAFCKKKTSGLHKKFKAHPTKYSEYVLHFITKSQPVLVWPSYLLEQFGEMQYTCDLISNNIHYFRSVIIK